MLQFLYQHFARKRWLTAWLLVLAAMANTAGAQVAPPGAAAEPPPGLVRLNLQGNIKLQALIDLIGQRMDLKFIYSAAIAAREINVKTPAEVPADTLPALLNSVLRMENLALADAEVPGWKRIVDVGDMAQVAQAGQAQDVLDRSGSATPVTQAFVVQHVTAQSLATLIRPFLSQPGSNVLAVPETNVLVVTDYAPAVLTVERLIQLIDRPRGEVVYEFYSVENTEAEKLAEQVTGMLVGRQPAAAAGGATTGGVELLGETRTNQIVVVGAQTLVDEALALLKRFDVSLGLTTQVYRVQYVKAERLDRIVQSFIPSQDAERTYQSSIDEEGNLLIVRTTAEIHGRIDELRRQIDVPVKVDESPIRFYRLKNANAIDVLYTLLALQEVAGAGGVLGGGTTPMADPTSATATMPDGSTPLNININQTQPGMNRYPMGANPFGITPYGPSVLNPLQGSMLPYGANQPLRLPMLPLENETGSYENVERARRDRLAGVLAPQLATGGTAVLPGGARVSADVGTNSLVIVAPAELQELYGRLIESLDVRRPQVLIEAKIVAIDTSDDFTLGVECSVGDRVGADRIFKFTSFGLSEVNPINGALQIIPALGFNGTLISPEIADVVIQAVATHNRARVLAAPRILVNDNATGQLESVTSVPFESVNASQTVSTTSLGGNQQAGTMITVTPHIKEDDHLQLEFSVEFSTFAESSGNEVLPPPRQIDRVGSAVTIPNGHTVIVGGLKRISRIWANKGVPGAERVPILRWLTSINAHDTTTTSFFLFIRPIVLRDDGFNDLKYLSNSAKPCAGIPGPYPKSRPVIMQ